MENLFNDNLKDKSKWNELLKILPIDKQDIYFTPEYYSIYEELGDGKANCFVYQENDSIAIYPFLINSVNDLGFDLDKEYFDIQGAYGYNGVLSNDDSSEFIECFYAALNKYCIENNIIAEFTRFHPLLKNHVFSLQNLMVIKDRATVYLDLHVPYDLIWEQCYSKNNRNMIRKAIKSGYSTKIINNPDTEKISQIYNMYTSTMKRIGSEDYYYFNLDYFINIFKNLSSFASIIEVLNDNGIVQCTAIVFVYGGFTHYHLSARIDGTDNSVNNLVLNEAVKYAQSKNAKYFHFGGGTTSKTDDPLLRFKSNFSKQRSDFYIGKMIHNQSIYDEVVEQWGKTNPEKVEKYKNMILKYRY